MWRCFFGCAAPHIVTDPSHFRYMVNGKVGARKEGEDKEEEGRTDGRKVGGRVGSWEGTEAIVLSMSVW
jgi:hypothetical protein